MQVRPARTADRESIALNIRRLTLASCLLFCRPMAVQGQSSDANPWFLRAGVAPAYILSPNPFLSNPHLADAPVRWAPNVTVEIGRQTDGNQSWHALYRMPSYGF